MLIQKSSLTKGDVIVLKLKQHTVEVVARLDEDFTATSTAVCFKRPLEAHVVQSQGGIGLAFMPFSMAARDDQVFRVGIEQLLLPPYPARDEVLKTYTEQTSSLKLP